MPSAGGGRREPAEDLGLHNWNLMAVPAPPEQPEWTGPEDGDGDTWASQAQSPRRCRGHRSRAQTSRLRGAGQGQRDATCPRAKPIPYGGRPKAASQLKTPGHSSCPRRAEPRRLPHPFPLQTCGGEGSGGGRVHISAPSRRNLFPFWPHFRLKAPPNARVRIPSQTGREDPELTARPSTFSPTRGPWSQCTV